MDLHGAGSRPSRPGPAERFTGSVAADEIAQMPNVSAGVVTFQAGARTAWHSHPGGQIVHALSGVGRIQADGDHLYQLAPGDTAVCPPGERHWHGAAPDHLFVQLAVQAPDAAGVGGADWFEHVSDEDYTQPAIPAGPAGPDAKAATP